MEAGRRFGRYVVVGVFSLMGVGCGMFDKGYTPVSDHVLRDPEFVKEANEMIGDPRHDPSYRVDWALSQKNYRSAKDVCLDDPWKDANEKFRNMQKVDKKKGG